MAHRRTSTTSDKRSLAVTFQFRQSIYCLHSQENDRIARFCPEVKTRTTVFW